MSSSLKRILELLDEALMHRPQPPVMTSRWHSQNPAGDVTARDQELPGATNSFQPGSTFYDDSLRPKSFLHDEVDEFNRILAELLQSKQRSEPTVDEDDFMCSCSCSQDDEGDALHITEPDCRPTNNLVVSNDFEPQKEIDIQHDFVLDSQPSVTHWTTLCRDDDTEVDEDDDDDDDDDDDVLQIVEEEDCLLAAKDCNVHSSTNIFTDDFFNEDDADSGYQSGNSTMIGPAQMSTEVSARCQLRHRVDCYNLNCRHTGLTMTIVPDSDVFQGFIRVHINLHKPITMAVTCPCVRDVTTALGAADVTTETESFYLPPNTSKVIHITSEMTTPAVIQTLLDKFLIADACQKFALYEKINTEHPKTAEERRLNGMLRRLADDEKPLQLCLRWADDGTDSLNRRQFVLQDNVTSEIAWDSFSLPELEAFLRILDREEESYCYQIQLKYGAKKKAAEMRLKQLADDNASRA